jgi:hypothetical protein
MQYRYNEDISFLALKKFAKSYARRKYSSNAKEGNTLTITEANAGHLCEHYTLIIIQSVLIFSITKELL